MYSLTQGSQGKIYVSLVNVSGDTPTPITDADVDDVVITLGGNSRSYKAGMVDFNNDEWIYPYTKDETAAMGLVVELSVSVTFSSGDIDKDSLGNVYIVNADDKEVE